MEFEFDSNQVELELEEVDNSVLENNPDERASSEHEAFSMAEYEDNALGTPRCFRGGDTFMRRLFFRLRMDHVVDRNAPAWMILKMMAVLCLVVLLDTGTRNPDRVSSTFTALMCLSPFITGSKGTILSTLIGSLIGTACGILVALATYVDVDAVPGAGWMLLLRIPLACTITFIVLLFIARYDPGTRASSLFSALFVNLVHFEWTVIAGLLPDSPRRMIWETLIVRLLALISGLFCSFVVDIVLSGPAPARILKLRLFFAERAVRSACSKNLDATSILFERSFNAVTSILKIVGDVEDVVHASWVFSLKTKELVTAIRLRSNALFKYLTFMSSLRLVDQSQAVVTLGRKAYFTSVVPEDLVSLSEPFRRTFGPVLIQLSRELTDTQVRFVKSPVPCWGKV